MGTTTFSGPIKAGTIKDTTGTTVGSDKANVGFVLMAQSGNVVFGANGTETVVATLPANSQIYQIAVDVTTAFDAGTLIAVCINIITSIAAELAGAVSNVSVVPLVVYVSLC